MGRKTTTDLYVCHANTKAISTFEIDFQHISWIRFSSLALHILSAKIVVVHRVESIKRKRMNITAVDAIRFQRQKQSKAKKRQQQQQQKKMEKIARESIYMDLQRIDGRLELNYEMHISA